MTLKVVTLEKLDLGAHTVTILFDNGKVDTRLTVKEAPVKPDTTSKPEAAKPTTPRTGDENSAELWIAVLALCSFGLSGVVITNKKRRASSKH